MFNKSTLFDINYVNLITPMSSTMISLINLCFAEFC